MLRICKTKEEYEAIELFKNEKEFKGLKVHFVDVELDEKVKSLAESNSLFGEREFFFVRCDKESTFEVLQKTFLESLEKSLHTFLLWGKTAEFKKVVEAAGYKVLEKPEPFKRDFPADFVAAVQSLDKRKAWVLLQRELENKNVEEVYGVANWAMKQAVTALAMNSFDSTSGLKEFQYRSVKKLLAGKDISVIQEAYFDLVNAYNSSRKESVSLDTALERWVLGW
jgi:hypothetical protein